MSFQPSHKQKLFLGLSTNPSETDILSVEFTELLNMNPFQRPGSLLTDPGFQKKYPDNLISPAFISSFRSLDLTTIYDVSSIGSSLGIIKRDTEVLTNFNTSFNDVNRFGIPTLGKLRINGYDTDLSNPATKPVTIEDIDRERFFNTGDFPLQTILGVFLSDSLPEEPLPQTEPTNPDIINATTGISIGLTEINTGTGTFDGSYEYRFVYIYDGFQLSKLSLQGVVSIGITNAEAVDITFRVHEDLRNRITGIQIYRSENFASLTPSGQKDMNFFFLDTIT